MIPRVQSAFDVKKAVDRASDVLDEIGFDASVLKYGYEEIQVTLGRVRKPDETALDAPGGEIIDRKQMRLVEKLRRLNINHKDWHSGWLGKDGYSLKITCAGWDFEGKTSRDIENLLPQWYENSHPSGFGNVKTLETEINVDVRNAHEINSSEFTVDQKLIKKVEETWSKHFLPKRVRATPYKIHIYGPEGQFKPHMDTPEKNLVGTFLVGLGDTTKPGSHLVLNGQTGYGSSAHDWVAFYPDIPHEVTRIESGYRAVIAFKIFRRDDPPKTSSAGVGGTVISTPEAPASTVINVDMLVAVESVLADLCGMGKPFAIHLTHLYNKGLIEPVGFDNILLVAARKQQVTQVRLLPVLCERRYTDDADNEDDEDSNTVNSSVYPLTDAHMDFLLGDKRALERESVQWLKGLEGIPFWSLLKGWEAGVMWRHDCDEEAGYTGNESRAHDEFSVYLTWAMIVFPNTA